MSSEAPPLDSSILPTKKRKRGYSIVTLLQDAEHVFRDESGLVTCCHCDASWKAMTSSANIKKHFLNGKCVKIELPEAFFEAGAGPKTKGLHLPPSLRLPSSFQLPLTSSPISPPISCSRFACFLIPSYEAGIHRILFLAGHSSCISGEDETTGEEDECSGGYVSCSETPLLLC